MTEETTLETAEKKPIERLLDEHSDSYSMDQRVEDLFQVSKLVFLYEKEWTIELDEIIGYGGVGAVFKGHGGLAIYDSFIENHPFAVKVAFPHLMDSKDKNENESQRIRFQRESQYNEEIFNALVMDGRGLEENIVWTYRPGDFGPIGKEKINLKYTISEYVDGKDFGSYKNLPLKDILTVGIIVSNILDVTHNTGIRGIFHRDIKPSNILIPDDNFEQAKLADFGLARRTDVYVPRKSSVFTLSFSAPEQINPKLGEPDDRVDIYGLSSTLYESITGKEPHPPIEMTEFLNHNIKPPNPPSLREFRQGIPDELNYAIMRGLEWDRKQRYQDMFELKWVLEDTYRKL